MNFLIEYKNDLTKKERAEIDILLKEENSEGELSKDSSLYNWILAIDVVTKAVLGFVCYDDTPDNSTIISQDIAIVKALLTAWAKLEGDLSNEHEFDVDEQDY